MGKHSLKILTWTKTNMQDVPWQVPWKGQDTMDLPILGPGREAMCGHLPPGWAGSTSETVEEIIVFLKAF